MSNFVFEGNFVVMDTIEFKSILDEIIDILSSCESMINADSDHDECFVCRNDIKENQNNATCESCDKHFHVNCIYKSDEKLADQRLIWICSCGNNNIAHRMFDRVCIPSHYNRYQALDDMFQDEDFECSQLIINKQRKRQSGRSNKRYVKKQKKTNVFAKKQSENDMKTNESNRCEFDLVAKENSSKTKDAKVESEQFDHDWVTVKSKKTKLMEKRKTRLHSHSKDDVTNKKHSRSINGVLLEPGVTYIGKAIKEYFGRQKSSNETKAKGRVDETQYRDGNGKSPSFHVKCPKSCQSRHDNVQSYTECLLNEYAKSVESPHSMETYSEKCKEINIKQTWADVARNSRSATRSVNSDVCTCHVFQQFKDDRCVTIQQLYGGGKSKKRAFARTKDGRFVSKKQSTNKNKSEHDEKSKSNQNDKNETCRPNDNINRQNSCSNQVPTMNADQDVKTCNLVCDEDKGNKMEMDGHSNSKADPSDKNETDCRRNTNVNQQKSLRNLISPKFETCCKCNHEIEQNENKTTCDSCRNHYHATCKGFVCRLKKLSGNTKEFNTIPDEISDLMSMNVDEDLKTGNLVCDTDKDKSNEIIIDNHSDCDTPVPVEDMCARDSESYTNDTYQYEGNVLPMSFNISGKRKDCSVNQELDKTHESVCKNEDVIKHTELNYKDDEETEFESDKGTFESISTLNSDSVQKHSYTTIKTIAQGNFHQGDPKFGDTAGTQCACNALIAILYTQTKNGNEINAHDMDVILNLGDELYSFTQTDSTMHNVLLMISELPNELHILNESFSMEYAQPIYGVLEGSEENLSSFGAMSLSQALQHQLPKYDACFMNFDQSIFAIIKGCNGYFVFDSHSRSRDGYLKEDGHSVLLYISSCEGIQRHCLTLAQSMGRCLNKTQFELTGVNVQVNRPSSYVSSSAECDKSNYVKNGNSDKQKTLEIEKDLNANSDTDEIDDGIIFISHDRCTERSDKYFKFVPLQTEHKKMLCFKLNINYCGTHSESLENGNGNVYIGKPIHIKRSIGDGNCYYRTMAHAIGGTERNHLMLRKANVTHLLQNEDLFRCTLDTSTYNSVREHVFANRLMDSGTWSNDTEIFSFANMIGFDIYSYNDQTQCWQIFCAKKPGHYNKITTERGIYMLYTGGNHFDVVESVATVDLSIVEEEQSINEKTEVINVDSNSETDIPMNESCQVNTKKRNLQTEIQSNEKYEPECKQRRIIYDVDSTCDVKPLETKRRRRKKSACAKRRVSKQQMRIKRCQEKSQCTEGINASAPKKSRKEKHADAMRTKYCNDMIYRLKKKSKVNEVQKRKYDGTFKSQKNEKVTTGEKLNNCRTNHREKIKERTKTFQKHKYQHNITFRENVKESKKNMYFHNVRFRENLKEKMKKSRKHLYQNNPSFKENFKEKMKKTRRHLYQNNPTFKENFKEKMKKTRRHLYQNNPTFKENFKEKMKKTRRHLYQNNPTFKENFKEKMKKTRRHLYQNNPSFKENFKEKIKKNRRHLYQNNPSFKENFKEKMKKTRRHLYQNNPMYRHEVKENNLKRSENKKQKMKNFDYVLTSFREIIAHGPEYVCCVCLKLLFEKQVKKCIKAQYQNQSCIIEKYVHICSSECKTECQLAKSPLRCLWICFTCHRKLVKGEIPAEASVNNLELDDIPEEFESLNNLEQHLTAINIPFMKIVNLPKGGQHGIHGPVVSVPSNMPKTVVSLPRQNSEDELIRVKLKRKLCYKGYYRYKFVNKDKVLKALQYLCKNNKWYSDITINEEWSNDLSHECSEEGMSIDQEIVKENDESNGDSRMSGIQLDTCLQPIDVGQEILDNYFDDIISCAPCEGNSPVALLNNESNEAKCFPRLFPSGQRTYHDTRNIKLTLGRYFLNRLLHVDNRFAQNTDYIFFAQCLYEMQQIISSVSIALRKGTDKKDDFTQVKVSDLKDASKIGHLLKSNEGYKFLKNVRGTPAYWQSIQKDILAMVRQLGKPTWFASFSSADMRWPEIMETLLIQTRDRRKFSELEWADKCNLLKSNPVTVARMFDQRFHSFMKQVILSESHPIGKVKDYFYRIEYQKRGSAHAHVLFWCEDTPQLGIDKDEEVSRYIDKYISCSIPSELEDPELHEIVNSVQIHSKRHSKSCQKKGTKCRFNFPRPPSERTFIIREGDKDGNDKGDAVKEAQDILNTVKDAVTDNVNYHDTTKLFEDLNITQKEFEDANNVIAKRDDVILKRNPQDSWVNQYNPSLLRAWNANMDIQYVCNEFACVAYVISYISKSEKEMGMLLAQTQAEMKDGNEDAKQCLRKLGHVYMQNREVCAQESVYRVCSLRLKECSRKVEFIPVGPNPVRMSLPLKVIQSKEDDEEIAWMPSKLDKYKARPDGPEFENMCLAYFCSYYRILSSSEIKGSKNKVELKNKLGFIQKRSRSDNAVIRYPRFNRDVAPEKYYLSILQLFLPFCTDEQLKPPQFLTYEEFYEKGCVTLCGNNLQRVESIVTENLQQFQKHADAVEQAQDYIDKFGPQLDAWGLLSPQTESERLEHLIPIVDIDDVENEFNLPDLAPGKTEAVRIDCQSSNISRQEINKMIRSLNEKQQHVFYKMRQWCLDKVNGKQPESFDIFITGGAGTGKSHLVKCIYHEGTRILGKMMENPDDVSILKVAPTGIAAYNINGQTIHSALSIAVKFSLPYQPLGEEKISQLRTKLGQLQILIIDEISMVDQKLLWYIHGRLRQLKQSRDNSPFGKVCIIAVGDFFQLPPVMGKPVYIDSVESALWMDNFKQVNLNEIMRQKEDAEFAILLNKLRTKERDEVLSDEDLAILRSRETGEQCEDALHIYSYNKDVFAWNKQMLHKKCTDVICIEADDTELDSKNKSKICEKPRKSRCQTSLLSHLWIACDARVMLLKNVDVNKGMTNGCMGNVTEIIRPNENSKPTCIKVKFDNDKIGTQAIEKFQESISKKYSRKQFPIKLAYACTVHKVQGMTMDKAVVNLKNTFLSGQAYVSLSRVTSLSGLVIENFDPKHIHCDPAIKECLSNMNSFLDINELNNDLEFKCCIMLHNIQGLKEHYADLQSNKLFLKSDFICLTETWINDENVVDVCMDKFKLYHQPRHQSYTNASAITSEFKNKEHGGVTVYAKNKCSSRLNINVKDIEFISFMLTSPISVAIAVIYRPPGYDIKQFCKSLRQLVEELHKVSTKCIIMGDFNEDLLKRSSHVYDLMTEYNYKQLIQSCTTEGGTILDLVFVKGLDSVLAEIIPIYYSYHEAIKINF